MQDLAAILDGFADALELERELGVRSFEIDRSLLAAPIDGRARCPQRAEGGESRRLGDKPPYHHAGGGSGGAPVPFVFLLDAPLTAPAAVKMMDGIVAYLFKLTGWRAAVLADGRPPAAHVYIAMGNKARDKWFPSQRLAMDRISSTSDGKTVAWTRSPGEVARMSSQTAMVAVKRGMMQTFLAVQQRIVQQ